MVKKDTTVICEGDETVRELAEKDKAYLMHADLENADLRDVDLRGANLRSANLRSANLEGANLRTANLTNSDLTNANLKNADLMKADLENASLYNALLVNADLRGASLVGADLEKADLRGVELWDVDLRNAELEGARIEFCRFPSIRMLSSINLCELPDDLTLEIMRRDAYAHPFPERFDEWAKGGSCPYQEEERFWLFNARHDLWEPGLPQMTDRDLILAICREKGWGIKSHREN